MSLEVEKVYRIVTRVKPPFIMYEPKLKIWTGLFIDILVRIANSTGLKYTIYPVADGHYGFYNYTSKKWNGMIQDLLTKKADIALGGLTVTRDRMELVDFTDPIYDFAGLGVLMKRIRMKTQVWGWITSLSTQVWIYLLSAYVVTSFLVWIYDTWSPYSFRNRQQAYINEPDSAKRFFTLKESFWFCFSSLTPQGGGEVPMNFSGRFASSAWWLFGFIVVATYTANMAAQLTLSRLEMTIDTYADLIRQLRTHFGVVSNSSAAFFYENMQLTEETFYYYWRNLTLDDTLSAWDKAQLAVWEYPITKSYTKIWRHMLNRGLAATFEDGVKKVRFGSNGTSYALIADNSDVLYQTMLHCELRMLPDVIAKRPYGIAVRKGSPLKRILNKVIHNFTDTDFLDKLKDKWWTNNPNKQTCVHLDDKTASLLIQNINGLFVTVMIGVAASYFILIFEIHYKLWLQEVLDSIGEFLGRKLPIDKCLKKTGLIKLKRPCKLAQSEPEYFDKKKQDPTESLFKRFG